MSLFEQLKQEIPELTDADFHPIKGTIHLRNDSDGSGDYIAKWEYSKPLPQGFKLGK
jgi:hypothetical protein